MIQIVPKLRLRFHLLALAPFAIAALFVFSAAWFTFLQTDDFCAFARVIHKFHGNPFLDTIYMYQNWAGRYSSMFVVALSAAASEWIPTRVVYGLSLTAFLALFAWACVKCARLITPSTTLSLPLAFAMFCGSLLLMPSKLEQYLWLTGAAVYFVGCSFLMILLQRLVIARETSQRSTRSDVAICSLIFMLVGFNEFLALIVGLLLAFEFCWKLLTKRGPEWKSQIAWVTIFLLALALSVLAPGNFVRDSTSGVERRDFVSATSLALHSISDFGSATLRRDFFAISTILLAAFFGGAFTGTFRSSEFKRWGYQALILLGAMPMHFWVYSYLTGEPTPGRVINQAWLLAVVAACLLMANAGKQVAAASFSDGGRFSQANALVLFGITGLMMLASPNFRTFAATTMTFGPLWHTQQVARDDGLSKLQFGNSPVVYLRAFERKDSDPPMFSGGDVLSTPDYWVNKCVADYYGVRSVRSYQPPIN